jgi:hypothetical protein
VETDEWISALGRYAERLHARAGPGHHVVSPLGAWMVVALCATVAGDEQARGELAGVLGTDPVLAAAFAARLLADPHPLVAAGAGAWVRPARETTRVKQWRAELPAVVDTGDIPSEEEIDRWTAERTFGLIEQFPIELSPDVVCLLATALATRVSWEVPFEVVDAAALGPSRWPALRRVLRPPPGDPRHRQYLAGTDRAGPVGAHLTAARGGLLVGSVIAADPAVPAGDVLAAAEEVVTAEARRAGSVTRLSLFSLPPGEGPVWSISEQQADTAAPDGQEEQVISVLPAWSAQTSLDLSGEELGFAAAARILAEALELGKWYYDARQAAIGPLQRGRLRGRRRHRPGCRPVGQGIPPGPAAGRQHALRAPLRRGRRRFRRPPGSRRQPGPQRLARAAGLLRLGERTHRRRSRTFPVARAWPNAPPAPVGHARLYCRSAVAAHPRKARPASRQWAGRQQNRPIGVKRALTVKPTGRARNRQGGFMNLSTRSRRMSRSVAGAAGRSRRCRRLRVFGAALTRSPVSP